jgi:tetratricopeptide (TPR) repeat protein
MADWSQTIELPDAPVDLVARALGGRAWVNYTRKAYAAFLADTENALKKQPALDFAAFNLGLALLACGRDADALNAYTRAGEKFPQAIDLGLADLDEARKKWLTEERAQPVIQLLRTLKIQRET